MFNFEIENHKPLRETVYDQIRKNILKGELVPGTRLMEIEIAETMMVSRTPIREAIRKLEREGLVVMEGRRGAYVASMSLSDMLDILELRSNLEGFAASLAAERMTEEQMEQLYGICKGFEEALKNNNTEKMVEKDTEFHNLLFESTGNKRLVEIVKSLQELVYRFRYLYFKEFKRAELMPAEHLKIYTAIKARDGEAARVAAGKHISVLREVVQESGLK